MSPRFRPEELEVPERDPFANDLLGRKEPIEALTTLLGNVNGPCVMAVDAGWGMGKTTFLRMWAQHLRNQEFPVVEFNAWETDFTWDPFFALWSESSGRLVGQDVNGSRGRLEFIARMLMPMLQKGARATALGLALRGEAELSEMASGVSAAFDELRDIAIEPNSERGSEHERQYSDGTYLEAKALLNEFRLELAQSANSLAEANSGRPLVLMIDELDRCRPTYSIELLETAKHLFSVDHVIFILCLDRAQLANSVKAVYGSSFDADGYLRRFFDVDYRLPEPVRSQFVNAQLQSLDIRDTIAGGTLPLAEMYSPAMVLIQTFFAQSEISLRHISQAIYRLSVVLNSTDSLSRRTATTIVILLLLRIASHSTYERLLKGQATDAEVVGAFFSGTAMQALRRGPDSASFEATLISCTALTAHTWRGDSIFLSLPLFQRYSDWPGSETSVDSNEVGVVGANKDAILKEVHSQCKLVSGYGNPQQNRGPVDELGFEEAHRHLELFLSKGAIAANRTE